MAEETVRRSTGHPAGRPDSRAVAGVKALVAALLISAALQTLVLAGLSLGAAGRCSSRCRR